MHYATKTDCLSEFPDQGSSGVNKNAISKKLVSASKINGIDDA
jgi:hypothetical protein